MAGVDQVVAVLCHACHHQAQQGRRLQFETLLALRQGKGVEVLGQLRTGAPVMEQEGNVQLFVHDLQGTLELTFPDETAAQHFMGVHGRLPGLAEALDVQPFDIHPQLIDVAAGLLLIQRMEQHALLHGRQRINVFDLPGRQWQRVQLSLGQPGQREVRRREALVRCLTAVLDQGLQLSAIVQGQRLDRRFVEHLRAERPVDTQFAGVDTAIEGQPVVQRRQRALWCARRFAGRDKQAIGIIGESAVELAQVVEGNAWHRQRLEGTTGLLIPQVAQRTESEPFVGYRPQLLLDRLERIPCGDGRGQAYREQAGEPADATTQIQIIEQRLTAVPLQLNQGRGVAGPAANHPGQSRQQQIVDLGSVGRRRLLQELSGLVFIQPRLNLRPMAPAQFALGPVARQIGASALQLPLPIGYLSL
ncbi:hypothetical protein PFLU4_57460 [Pseudomonas fluorescens]|nr:hypothetical protein PFLU4_57460 [Pseudomonas fluorescens]